jgi:hypothetical protein
MSEVETYTEAVNMITAGTGKHDGPRLIFLETNLNRHDKCDSNMVILGPSTPQTLAAATPGRALDSA